MITLVDLEKARHPALGCPNARRAIKTTMFVSLLACEEGRARPVKLWMKVISVSPDLGPATYVGVLIVDTFLDIELGAAMPFGPEHILEWSTQYP